LSVILTGRKKPLNKSFDRSGQSEFGSFFQFHVTRPVNSSVRCQWCPDPDDEVCVRQMNAQQPAVFQSCAEELAKSRWWARIHYTWDNNDGLKLGRGVADKVIEWAKADGAQ
jgi:hypothetical protein